MRARNTPQKTKTPGGDARGSVKRGDRRLGGGRRSGAAGGAGRARRVRAHRVGGTGRARRIGRVDVRLFLLAGDERHEGQDRQENQ